MNYLEDTRLSFKARGLLATLLHIDPHWCEMNLGDIKHLARDGRDASTNAYRELLKYGYIRDDRERNGGRFATGVLVYSADINDDSNGLERL